MEKNGVLVLEDGTVVVGKSFGADAISSGEVVFNTSMTGYQEYLTDPSYKYQIFTATYPLIGNYGIQPGFFESDKVHVEGFVVREYCEKESHADVIRTLSEFLKENKIPAIQGVDTRMLTKKIRVHGVMLGVIKTPFEEKELPELIEQAKNLQSISEMDLVSLVTTKKTIIHTPKKSIAKVVLVDCGTKRSIMQSLFDRGVEVVQVPASTTAKEIKDYEPDGVVFSNGPGDPEKVPYVISTAKKIIDEQLPTMGICLGNQMIGLAMGCQTYKLKFGHRGANQPVKDLKTSKVHITSQNHSFALDENSFPKDLEVRHINLNDRSVEAVHHKSLPVMAYQYHPEAHCGPRDTSYLFDEFIEKLK